MSSSPIQLVVGLGNPGPEYAQTRHNAGFWFVDELVAGHGGLFRADNRFRGEVCRVRVAGRDCRLLKPTTFMNHSGQSVAALVNYYRVPRDAVLVVHDELDLPPGTVRLKQGGGHGGHNGLRDILKALGGADFWRLRVGIGHPGDSRQVVDYVLGRPSKEERSQIEEALSRALASFPEMLRGEFQKAMNRLHPSR